MLSEKFYPARVVVLLLVAIVLSVVALNARADDKTFKLNEPLAEQFVACLAQADAEDIIKTDVNDHDKLDELVQAKAVGRKCGLLRAWVVYKQLTLRLTKDGEKYSVYEAEVAGHTLYIPMKGWVAEGEVTL